MLEKISYSAISKTFILTIFLVLCTSLGSCKTESYSARYFSFPPDSKPHDNNWDYFGYIKMTSDKSGSFSSRSHKSVYIRIVDTNKKIYLEDKMVFNCGGIKTSIQWDQFGQLVILLNEVGNKFSDDTYNKQLLKNGPNNLIQLKYYFDNKLKKFTRIGPSL